MPAPIESVVVNTGPLIALAACGCLPLLRPLFGAVCLPESVHREFMQGSSAPAARMAKTSLPEWMEVLAPALPTPVMLDAYLDPGEADVIELAIERKIGWVAIDEKRGRRVARCFGLSVIGSVGLLLRAKQAGLITMVRPNLDLMLRAGIWIGEQLWQEALRAAGE